MVSTCDLRRRLHVDARIDLHLGRLRLLAPLRQRRDLVAGLDLVNRVVVGRAVGLGAADDPDIRRRRVDALRAVGSLNSSTNLSRRSGQPGGVTRKLPASRSGRAPARRGEHVGPHVEHRQQVIAAAGVGRRDDHRLLGQIEPAAGIERVEVRPTTTRMSAVGNARDIGERVHRAADASRARLLIGELLARQVHGDERIEIEIGVDADRVRLLLGDGRLRCRRERRGSKQKSQNPTNDLAAHVQLLLALACPNRVALLGRMRADCAQNLAHDAIVADRPPSRLVSRHEGFSG